MRTLFLLAGTVALTWQAHAAGERLQPLDWKTFVEPSFGTRVEYPSEVFSVADGPTKRGIGQQFRTDDSRAQLEIYSLRNEGRDSPASFLRNHLRIPDGALSYRRVTSSFFAISAVDESTILYSRCNFSASGGGAIHCIDLRYPAREKRAWDGVVTRISRSLRPLL